MEFFYQIKNMFQSRATVFPLVFAMKFKKYQFHESQTIVIYLSLKYILVLHRCFNSISAAFNAIYIWNFQIKQG